MLSNVVQKLKFLYKPYALGVVSLGYVLGELGHYMIGKFTIDQFTIIASINVLAVNFFFFINELIE